MVSNGQEYTYKPMKTCQHAGLLIMGLAMPMSAQPPVRACLSWTSAHGHHSCFAGCAVHSWLYPHGKICNAAYRQRSGRMSGRDEDLGKARSASEDAARIQAEYEADLDATGLRRWNSQTSRMRPPSRLRQATQKSPKSRWAWRRPKLNAQHEVKQWPI